MKTDKKFSRFLLPAAMLLLFAAAVIWFVIATEGAERVSQEQRLDTVKSSVDNAVTLCYSIEGAYPDSLEYLTENYDISYDRDRYIVHYECFASNIRPIVTVIEKEGAHE